MAFSYWRTGTNPANQGAQGTIRNNGFGSYGSYALPDQQWGRCNWNKWAWSGSCLRTDAITVNMWRPNQLGACLKSWLQGDHNGGANGVPVTTWLDDSGNGNSAVGIGNNPDLAAAALNGLNVVQFVSANNDGLQLPSGAVSAFTEGSIFFVTKVATIATGSPIQGFGSSGANEHYPFSDNHVYNGFLSTVRYDTGTPSGLTSWHIASFQSKAGDWRYAINGTDFYTTGTNTVGAAAGISYLGSNTAFNFDGSTAEVVICNSFLTTNERQRVEGYLAWKWGLQASLLVGHPYVTSPPLVPDAIFGTTGISLTPTGTLTGIGALTGSSALVLAPSGTLTGKGALTGSSSVTLSPSGTITGKGLLTGTTALVLSPSGTLQGVGVITGASSLVLAPAGTLSGAGSLVGSTSITLSAAGSLTGIGTLLGSTALSLSLTGTLNTPVTSTWTVVAPVAPSFVNDNPDTGIWTEVPPNTGTWT